MNKETKDRIEDLLSIKKVALYRVKSGNNWFDAYRIELEQAKEIFIYLHFLEIFLRNKIATEFSADLGDWLFDARCSLKLNFREQEKIGKVIADLNKLGKEINLDNIVSSLNFGFWTNLFHNSYHVPIWQQNKMLERIFPFFKPHQRDLKKIQKEMEAIRKFRNRVFHFESLQSWNFKEMKSLIDRFIFGIGGLEVEDIIK